MEKKKYTPWLHEEDENSSPVKVVAESIACLYFLHRQAVTSGYEGLSKVFIDAINKCEDSIGIGSPTEISEVIGSDLFHAMEFLERCLQMSKPDLKQILDMIEADDESFTLVH